MVIARFRGGRFGRLADLSLAWVPLVVISVVVRGYIRAAPSNGWPLTPAMIPWLYLASYSSILAFCWRNRRYPGLTLIGAGAALNFLVIAANGFQMPVLPRALQSLGIDPAEIDMSLNLGHRLMDGETVLRWLGDIVPVRIPGAPRQVFRPVPMSIGDFLEIAGTFLLVQAAMGARRNRASQA